MGRLVEVGEAVTVAAAAAKLGTATAERAARQTKPEVLAKLTLGASGAFL